MKRFILLLILLLFSTCNASGYKQILYGDYNPAFFSKFIDVPIVAVSSDGKSGVSGWMRIAFIEGGGEDVIFDSRTNVDDTTIGSALSAIAFAESYLNETHDYFISYDLKTDKVSGGSTGSSIALGIIALAANRTLNRTLITGAIDCEGNLIATGGMPIKAPVAASAGYKNMIIPLNSSRFTVMEKHIAPDKIYYVSRELDMISYSRERYGIELIECVNLKDCLDSLI